jgi:hypothetical protein
MRSSFARRGARKFAYARVMPSLAFVELVEQTDVIDEILGAFSGALGPAKRAYHGHAYRVFNCARWLLGTSREDRTLAIASSFHDLGIWSDHTFDYLAPSIARATEYVATRQSSGPAAVDSNTVARIIAQHHRLRRVRGSGPGPCRGSVSFSRSCRRFTRMVGRRDTQTAPAGAGLGISLCRFSRNSPANRLPLVTTQPLAPPADAEVLATVGGRSGPADAHADALVCGDPVCKGDCVCCRLEVVDGAVLRDAGPERCCCNDRGADRRRPPLFSVSLQTRGVGEDPTFPRRITGMRSSTLLIGPPVLLTFLGACALGPGLAPVSQSSAASTSVDFPDAMGACYDATGTQIRFRVHSPRATHVEVDLYAQPAGAEEVLPLPMALEPGSDVWDAVVDAATLETAGLAGVQVSYGYRAWGRTGPTWRRGRRGRPSGS